MDLSGTVAVITGGDSGIGFASTPLSLAAGADVVIMSNNPETLGTARSQLGAKGIRSIPIERLNDAEEVAEAALFPASGPSSSMQPAEIVIDGGASRAPQGAPAYRV